MIKNIKSILAACTICMLLVPSVGAQTRFDFPDSRVDVTKFNYVENCRAAADRVQDSLDIRNLADPDTVALRGMDNSNPIAPEVLAVTTKCLAKFTPEQIPASFAQIAQQAFLYAGRDEDAAKIVKLRSQAIADSTSRAFVLDSFARNYVNASPRRVAQAHAIVDEVLKYGDRYRGLQRAGMCYVMMRAAVQMRDEQTVKKYGHTALIAIQNLNSQELAEPGVQLYLWQVIRELNQQVYKKELFDSLRVSTKAFVDFQAGKFNEFASKITDRSPVGLQTVPLSGDYWFPESAAEETYPRKGKVTILNFPGRSPDEYNKDVVVITRRLATRYPQADQVLVGSTLGYFGPGAQQDTKIEAEYQNRLFREHRKNPNAVVGIAVSEIIELPPPDKRRVHLPPVNYVNYPNSADERYIFIIDEDGLLVERAFIGASAMHTEMWLDELLQVLMERHKQRSK